MLLRRFLVLVGVLFIVLPAAGEELWVAPAVDSPSTAVGDWAVTSGGGTHFSFAVPADMVMLVSAKVVLIGKNDKDEAVDLYLSVAQNDMRHDDYATSILGIPVAIIRDHLQEVDVTAIFPSLFPGDDYVSLYFRANSVRVVGLRFSFVGALAEDLAAETAAREAADDALQSALNAEISARIAADDSEAASRLAVDAALQAQIDADLDTDPTNELITNVEISGSQLQISEGGTNHSVDLGSISGVPFFPYLFVGDYIEQGKINYVVPDNSSIYSTRIYKTGVPGTFVGMVTHTYTYSASQYAQPETYTLRVNNSDTGMSCVGRECNNWDTPVSVTADSWINVKVEVPLTDSCVESGGNVGCAGVTPVITLYFVPDIP